MSTLNRSIGIIIILILLCQWVLGYQLPAAMTFFLGAWLDNDVVLTRYAGNTVTSERQAILI